MRQPRLVKTLGVGNVLGEGIIWDARDAAAWWTDIQRSTLYRYTPASDALERWTTPERLACFARIAGDQRLLAGFESGFAFYDPVSGRSERIVDVEGDQPATRLNDGRADRQGRFWAGSMVEGEAPGASGSLYRLGHNLDCTKTLTGLSISNGLCWSPDSSVLYHTDTPSGRIDRYEFDADTGDIGERQVFASCEPGSFPDGSTVDADGCVWNAEWGARRVVRYAPDGSVDLVLPVPASQPTCVAFGGDELNLLFVTSATEGLDRDSLTRDPEAGNVFVFETQTRGIADAEFGPRSSG